MNKILYKNCRFLISEARPEGIVENGSVYIEGPIIKEVGSPEELERNFETEVGVEVLDCRDKIVMPGLIDSHNHLANYPFNLVPGLDLELDTGTSEITTALMNVVHPAYAWATPESTYDLQLFGLMNCLKHGTTTTTNAFHFPEVGYQAAEYSGMRVVLHPQMITSIQLGDGLDEDGYLADTEEAIKNFHNTLDGRIQVAVHPHTLYSCRESMLMKSIALAEKYDVGFATHLLESPEDRVRSDQRYQDRGGLIPWMRSSGMLQERSLFFHCAQLNEEEIEVFAEQGCAVAHNPQSNTFFGDVAYVPAMLNAGVKVGLGTDAPIGNLFDQMFAAGMLHNVMPRDKRGLEPWMPLELATSGSARALRLEDRIGSLEVGKRADIITIDLSSNTSIYPLNAGILLGWIAEQGAGTIVCDAMVDGVFLRRENEFTIFDEDAIIAHSDEWLGKFSKWYLDKKEAGEPHVQIVHEDYQDN